VIARPHFAASGLVALWAAFLTAAPAHAAVPIPASSAASASRSNDASLDDYRKHLQALTTLVQACAKARDLTTCDPMKVGPDDRVPLTDSPNAERRLVRYGWLRVLLSKAQDPDRTPDKEKAAPKSADPLNESPGGDPTLPPPPTTSQLLADAETRLARDLAQTDKAPSAAVQAAADTHAGQRQAMKEVLAGRDFRNLEAPSARDTLLEKFGNWLNNLLNSVAEFSSRSAWIARLLIGGFILAVCVGLVWGLLQLERRWRLRLVPDDHGPAADAASARDWQLWLEDARKSAAAGLWREAIHFVYWAAISRLESRRLWPADRARTPREYLALVAPEDPRKPGLATLTGSFESTWYGGRAAAENDYRRAEQLANALISGTTAPAPSTGGAE
jgi:hypothetical protein